MAISTRELKNELETIFNREITDNDIQKLVNFRLVKKVRFKDSFYYEIIGNPNNILPTISEVLNDS